MSDFPVVSEHEIERSGELEQSMSSYRRRMATANSEKKKKSVLF